MPDKVSLLHFSYLKLSIRRECKVKIKLGNTYLLVEEQTEIEITLALAVNMDLNTTGTTRPSS